jgi:hypothetical protein
MKTKRSNIRRKSRGPKWLYCLAECDSCNYQEKCYIYSRLKATQGDFLRIFNKEDSLETSSETAILKREEKKENRKRSKKKRKRKG